MASWKKVIVSGSQAELAGVTGSLLTDDRLLFAQNGGAISSTSVSVNSQGHLDGTFSGSFNLNALTDGNGINVFTYDGNSDVSISVQADGSTLSVGSGGVKVADAGITATQLNTSVAGDGLTGGGGTALAVNVDDSSIEINSDQLRVKAGGVTNAMLANKSVHISGSGINGTSVDLGATASIDVDVDDVTIEIADNSIQLKSGSISVGHLDSDLLVIESEGIASNDNDNTIATVAAIKDYVDTQVGGANLDITGSGDTAVSVDLNDEDLIFAGESGVMSVSASVADGDVTITTAIVDGGIQNAKLADGTIANAKLVNDSVHISGSGISAASVALGATASIAVQVDDSSIEIDGDQLQVKAGGVTNAMLANSSVHIGDTSIALGATGSSIDALTLTNAEATGSFTGSFVGDGSGLTGLATTLNVTDGSNPQAIDLQSETLTFAGTANEITVSTATADTLTIGLPDDVIIAGDLTVNGTTTTLNTQNLLVEDAFILLASGSTGATDGGIIVDGGDNNGEMFGWDTGVSRWGFQSDVADNASALAPEAFAAAVVTSDVAAYQKVGNIRINTTTEEIFIYS